MKLRKCSAIFAVLMGCYDSHAKLPKDCRPYPGNPEISIADALIDFQIVPTSIPRKMKDGGARFDAGHLSVRFNRKCTLAEVNEILAKRSACIRFSLKGSQNVGILFNDPGSVAKLRKIQKELKSEKCIEAVNIPFDVFPM